MRLGIACIGIGANKSSGLPSIPVGFVFVVDDDGFYLTDDSGNFYITEDF